MIYILIAIIVLIIVVVAIAIALRQKRKTPIAGAATYRELLGVQQPAPAVAPVASNDLRIAELRQNLRVKLLYQEDKIDAAIQLERDRSPNASLEELMQAAIKRWERDNQ